jgi:hypothetical protein
MQPAAAETAVPDARPHPNYIGIFGILFVLTVVEVGVAFVGLSRTLTIMALILLALSPLPLAIILVVAVLTEF